MLLRDLVTVHPDAELTGVAHDELRGDPEVLLELGRRPGGLGPVASRVAVTDRDLHGSTVARRFFRQLLNALLTNHGAARMHGP